MPQQGAIESWFTFKYDSSAEDHANFFINGSELMGDFDDIDINTFAIEAGWSVWSGNGKSFGLDMDNQADDHLGIGIRTPDFSACSSSDPI